MFLEIFGRGRSIAVVTWLSSTGEFLCQTDNVIGTFYFPVRTSVQEKTTEPEGLDFQSGGAAHVLNYSTVTPYLLSTVRENSKLQSGIVKTLVIAIGSRVQLMLHVKTSHVGRGQPWPQDQAHVHGVSCAVLYSNYHPVAVLPNPEVSRTASTAVLYCSPFWYAVNGGGYQLASSNLRWTEWSNWTYILQRLTKIHCYFVSVQFVTRFPFIFWYSLSLHGQYCPQYILRKSDKD